MTNPSFTYKSSATCHARINQLEALLSLPLSAEEYVIDKAWLRITELEKMLEDKGAPPAKSTPSKPATQPAAKVDPSTPTKKELHGVERATAALREGRTAKPTPTGDGMPATGWGKAARAQAQRNADRTPKS